MTLEASVEREVVRARDEVWETLTDFAAYPQRMGTYESLEFLGPDRTGAGTRWRQVRTVYGRSHAQVLEVIRWEEPSLLELRAREAGAIYTTTYELTPTGDGTRVQMRFQVEGSNMLARAFQRLFGARLMRSVAKGMDRDLRELVQPRT